MNTKAKGDIGEQLACEYLVEKGFKIIGRNVKLAKCEIDIVAEAYFDNFDNLIPQKSTFFDKIKSVFHLKNAGESKKAKGKRTLVFIEVKTRTDDEHGAPEEAVDGYKKGRYVTAAKSYVEKFGEQNTPVRFDVITVEDGKINHIENAFTTNDARYPKR